MCTRGLGERGVVWPSGVELVDVILGSIRFFSPPLPFLSGEG